MLAGTPEGKEIRKYFVAVEEVSHVFMKQQLEDHQTQLAIKDVM